MVIISLHFTFFLLNPKTQQQSKTQENRAT